ncbi:MAG: hypothetical protein QM676_00555 [Novosphingobium sp.]
MDMGFDHTAWPQGQSPGAEAGAVNGRLDWHGLRARFLAVRAFRQVQCDASQAAEELADASFDRSAAQALATFDHAFHGINLNDSTDGKALSIIEESVAGASKRGDRG